jgi:sugar/nucleoside kinase (ribokinase family)
MSQAPEFLTVGHITRDMHSDGSFSLGGTVTFAALTAYHLGLASSIVTCADQELIAVLPEMLPDISVHARPSAATTTFVNIYTETGFRTQYLRARADALVGSDIPSEWQAAPVVLLGPLAQELDADFASLFPRRPGRIVAATPQGWLRHWDNEGRVWPTPWQTAEQVLPALDVLILSHDDLLPFANDNRKDADAILARWSMQVPLLVATDGRHGATLFRQGNTQRFPAYTINEVDPTGAGDVFAASFITHLYRHGNAEDAVNFANCVASFSAEQPGIQGIPTPEMINARLSTALR